MRAAYQRAGNRVVQIGHQSCSLGHVTDALNYLASGSVGHITAIRANMYRNTPHGKPQWTRPVYPDMTAETIDWNAFLGSSAPARDFDADRYINWRLFQDYSGGNVHENMSQQIAFWYKVMGLDIPYAVTMTGGLYRWQDGREVPDTMNVVMEHETLLFSWDSGFGNNQLGITEDVLGTDGTISKGQQIRYLPQKVNRPDGIEMLGQTNTPPRAHMENFLDAIRTGRQTNCPFEIGFRVSIACSMAIESFYAGRTVRWDPAKEEIV
jgi:predicted dehydrogenase